MRLFLFAIGGTGSRVLKSLTMLLASGVRPVDENGRPVPDLELVPIIIDPHKSNEDLKRTEALLNAYRELRAAIHGTDTDAEGFFATRVCSLAEVATGGTPIDDSFVLNMSTVEREKFRDFIGYDTMDEGAQALTSLLFADYQLENKMNIGFVGSPNIGSVALNEVKDSPQFKAMAGVFRPGDRIFFISSIFGGTGAAGFPILVKNIRQAAQLDQLDNRDALSRAPIGGLTILPYFNLERSKDDHRIDTADFIVKTQSALHYYRGTLTSANDSNVNAIYYLGDQVHSLPQRYDPGEHGQRNAAHLVELVGALAPLHFAGLPVSRLSDPEGAPKPTVAFEYALEKDVHDIDFTALGPATRNLIYDPMARMQLMQRYLQDGLKRHMGQGFTQDQPRIKADMLTSQFYRTLTERFVPAWCDWLDEMHNNSRSVSLVNPEAPDMAHIIHNVEARKGFFGRKTIDDNTFKALMNRESRNADRYAAKSPEFKLLDLLYRAAGEIVDTKFENIN